MTTIINGKESAEALTAECKEQIAKLQAAGIVPGLAVVLVGSMPASVTYVNSKIKKCEALGVFSKKIELPENISTAELLQTIRKLNDDPAIDGILVQAPLPPHINFNEIIAAIEPSKDVDGLHPISIAKLAMEEEDGFAPCTPAGCAYLLERYGVKTAGANVLIIGRSLLVGKPLALMLAGKKYNATVTLAHSRSKDLPRLARQADIIVAAVGQANMVKADWITPGAVVLDVGINREPNGKKILGDVAFDEVAPLCSAITPVPGGVGLMTVAMLMSNTIKAAKLRRNLK